MKKLLSTTALVLTLAVSGMSVAQAEWDGKSGHSPHFMEKALSALPEPKAAEFREAMKVAHEQNQATYTQMKQLREDLNALLTAPTFDKAAYLEKEKQIAAAKEKMHNAHTEAFASAAANLSQDERKKLASAMHTMHEKHHKHEDKKTSGDKKETGKK